jgi:pimeloyl-ACP methyl ester carboxylesterase
MLGASFPDARDHVFARAPGVPLGFSLLGRGPERVLLLMGFTVDRSGWTDQLEWLNAHPHEYEVAALDNRGVGASASAPRGRYTTAQLAEDAIALLRHLGWRRAHIVGISMGGMIAQELALAAPHVVQSLTVLVSHAGGWRSMVPTAGARLMASALFSASRTAPPKAQSPASSSEASSSSSPSLPTPPPPPASSDVAWRAADEAIVQTQLAMLYPAAALADAARLERVRAWHVHRRRTRTPPALGGVVSQVAAVQTHHVSFAHLLRARRRLVEASALASACTSECDGSETNRGSSASSSSAAVCSASGDCNRPLIVGVSDDLLVAPPCSRYLHEALGGDLAVLADAGHGLLHSHTREVNALLEWQIRRHAIAADTALSNTGHRPPVLDGVTIYSADAPTGYVHILCLLKICTSPNSNVRAFIFPCAALLNHIAVLFPSRARIAARVGRTIFASPRSRGLSSSLHSFCFTPVP